MLAVAPIAYNQTSESYSENLGRFGSVSLKWVEGVTDGEPYEFFIMSFQNKQYTQIKDIAAVGIFNTEEFNLFTESLSKAIEKAPNKSSANWNLPEDCKIATYQAGKIKNYFITNITCCIVWIFTSIFT